MNISDRLQELAILRQLALERFNAGEYRKLSELFDGIADEIEDALRGKPLTEFAGRRLDRQIAELISLVQVPTPDLQELPGVEARWAVSSLAVVSVEAVLPPASALANMAETALIQGAVLSQWMGQLNRQIRFDIERTVRSGVALGRTNQQIARDVLGIQSQGDKGAEPLKRAKRDAMALTRTAVQTFANQAILETYRANDDVLRGVEYSAKLDSRTTPQCAALDGAVWDLEGNYLSGPKLPFAVPPIHWQCLPGDSLITSCGPISGVSKRWIDADLVVIKVATGNEISCTPNHPILTDRGWVAAHLVNEFDKVACGAIAEREGLAEWDNQNVVPSIHDVAESFFRARQVVPVPMPVAAKDFHGDGANSDVAVVWSDSFLRHASKASADKELQQSNFINGNFSSSVSLIPCGHFAFFFQGLNLASSGIMSIFCKCKSIFGACYSHARKLLLTAIPSRNAVAPKNADDTIDANSKPLSHSTDSNAALKESDDLAFGCSALFKIFSNRGSLPRNVFDSALGQNSLDDLTSDAKLASDLFAGKYGVVSLHNVVSVGKRKFSGHVYNLETVNGFYASNGIITHNCRSRLTPVTKTFRELGIDVDEIPKGQRASAYGPVSGDMKFEAFMERQGPEFAEKVLGKGRYELYKAKNLTLAQLIDPRTLTPLTLAELREL